MEFSNEEKIVLFDKIAQNYFTRNFGSMSKVDLETLLFSEYLEHCIDNGIAYDDYTLSKELGITQARIRILKERKQLKYPRENFQWELVLAETIQNAKYDNKSNCIKMIIQDVNVMNEVRNYIENRGWYDECSLNKKLLQIPLACFVDIFHKDEDFEKIFSKEIKKKIKKLAASDKPEIGELIKDFTKKGLNVFFSKASPMAIVEVLTFLQNEGISKLPYDAIFKILDTLT